MWIGGQTGACVNAKTLRSLMGPGRLYFQRGLNFSRPGVHACDQLAEGRELCYQGFDAGVPAFFESSRVNPRSRCDRSLTERDVGGVGLSRHVVVHHGELVYGRRFLDERCVPQLKGRDLEPDALSMAGLPSRGELFPSLSSITVLP